MARARAGAVRPEGRVLNPLEMLNFRVGIGLSHLNDRERRAVYFQHREELLTGGNWAPLLCEVFWAYEPGIPDELRPREDDEVCYGDDFGRLAWLLAHRELFEELADGERLYARLQARQLAEQAA